MTYKRGLVVAILGVGVFGAGLAIRARIDKIRMERLSHIAVPAPYFPAGSIWTQDVSAVPVDPQSSTMIGWLAGQNGGWGTGKMRVDFAIRVLRADASTPLVPFRKGPGFYEGASDVVPTLPLPVGGGMEGQKDYHCPLAE